MSEQIKPCPFCGGKVAPENDWGDWCVECSVCRATGPMHASKSEAIELWNAAPRPEPVDMARADLSEWDAASQSAWDIGEPAETVKPEQEPPLPCHGCAGMTDKLTEVWLCPECIDRLGPEPARTFDMQSYALRAAVNAECTCGGRGPDDGACPACMVWHRLVTLARPATGQEPR